MRRNYKMRAGNPISRIARKLARRKRLTVGERETLGTALIPLVRSVTTKTVWRRGLSDAAFRAEVDDVVQDAWVITLKELLPDYTEERGSVFAFVRVTLRWRLIDWLERRSDTRTVSLIHPEAVADISGDDSNNGLLLGQAEHEIVKRVLRTASIEDRAIFKMRRRGESHASVAATLGLTPAATRLRLHRLCQRIREAAKNYPG
jgi:RNA polymerase sigma factor (sigma-70 family)